MIVGNFNIPVDGKDEESGCFVGHGLGVSEARVNFGQQILNIDQVGFMGKAGESNSYCVISTAGLEQQQTRGWHFALTIKRDHYVEGTHIMDNLYHGVTGDLSYVECEGDVSLFECESEGYDIKLLKNTKTRKGVLIFKTVGDQNVSGTFIAELFKF
jgi:hypothetical protein